MFSVIDKETGKEKIPTVIEQEEAISKASNYDKDEDGDGDGTSDNDNDGDGKGGDYSESGDGDDNASKKKDSYQEDESADEEQSESDDNPLDSSEMDEFHSLMIGHYINELGRQAENREQMAVDEDYYDSIQWTEEDASILRARGQAPIVYNVISQSVNWVIGSEKRGRSDFKILPRGKEDTKPAERKTQLLKYLSDVNRTTFHRSRAFEDAVKAGVGWIEDGVQDDPDEELLYSRYESWRNMLWDSSGTELDLNDARYLFRSKWVDLDISKTMFPGRGYVLEQSVSESLFGDINGDAAMDMMEIETTSSMYNANGSFGMGARKRVRLIECWFKAPVREERISGGSFHGLEFDDDNEEMQIQIQEGKAVVHDRLRMRMHVALMTDGGMLFYDKSPYIHNKFPFTPIWGYRRGRDGMPYGLIRSVRDMQDDINKRASKAQYILSTNKVIMDDDAIDDMEEFLEQVSMPDGVIRKKKGSSLEINADRELGAAHLELMSRSISMVQQASGVTDELLGKSTNATSGVAVQKRQEQGSLATSKFFDNLRLAVQIQGEKQLSNVEQFFTEAKTIRITNARGTPTYVDLNDGTPENSIIGSKADFIISEADWRASMQQAQVEKLMEMLPMLPPNVAMTILDLLVESMDIANKDEIVERIRNATGQSDPDQDEDSEEAQAAAQQAAAQQEKQAALEKQQFDLTDAEIEYKASQAASNNAEIATKTAKAVTENIEQQQVAINAATKIFQMPAIAGIADVLLQESGFIGNTELGEAQDTMEQDAVIEDKNNQAMQMKAQMQGGGANGMQGMPQPQEGQLPPQQQLPPEQTEQ